MRSATKAQTDAMTLYAEIMEEAKIRLGWIDDALNGLNGFHGQLIREVCYLQFRLICELVALGWAARTVRSSSQGSPTDRQTSLGNQSRKRR